jgi:hypothetical protein
MGGKMYGVGGGDKCGWEDRYLAKLGKISPQPPGCGYISCGRAVGSWWRGGEI